MTSPPEPRGRRLPFAFSHLDASVRRELVHLEASDSAMSFGALYQPPDRRTTSAVYLMHPRGEFSRHYVVPGLVANGFAVFCHNSRYLNNDTDMVHERLLFDIAAGIRFLKEQGFERIVLLGNSGGGSLLAFYQSQAEHAPSSRLVQTPGGEAIDLAGETMPAADLYIATAAHLGEGRFILNVLDPAVIDESRPELSDAQWDMYMEQNGYRPFPEASHYDPAWLTEYRARQRDRCRRLDAMARQFLLEQDYYREQIREPGFDSQPPLNRAAMTRRARLWRYMVIYRTLANPAYLDPTIEPNRRRMGSIFAPADPIVGNYGPGGLARIMTPRAWLSTWSGLSSQADLPDSIGHVTVPTLIVYADGDSDIFPSEQAEIFEKSGAIDKTFIELEYADHYLNPVGESGAKMADPRARLIDFIVPWIKERIGES
jgi:pimeloyl-ACP methyl ester carboxylesterase